jgi:hypothetical protein
MVDINARLNDLNNLLKTEYSSFNTLWPPLFRKENISNKNLSTLVALLPDATAQPSSCRSRRLDLSFLKLLEDAEPILREDSFLPDG